MNVSRGPLVYRIRGPANALETQLAGGSIANPTNGTAVVWQWPRDVLVESIYATCDSGVLADDAGLELAITDEEHAAIVSDGRTATFASALALFGRRRRWLPLQKGGRAGWPVQAREKWRIQFRNVGANAINPRLYVRIADAN